METIAVNKKVKSVVMNDHPSPFFCFLRLRNSSNVIDIKYWLYFKPIKQWSLDGQLSLEGKFFQNRSINKLLEKIQTTKLWSFCR
jgi:hypothetical protein